MVDIHDGALDAQELTDMSRERPAERVNGGALALAFIAGTVATVNPCGFALLPAYLSYFLGLGDDRRGSGESANPVLRALAVSAAVTLGFVVVFGVMGVTGPRCRAGWGPVSRTSRW